MSELVILLLLEPRGLEQRVRGMLECRDGVSRGRTGRSVRWTEGSVGRRSELGEREEREEDGVS